MHRRTLTLASVCGLATGAGLLIAGPLSPPAGLVTSSYKTLNEVEPRIAINATNTPGDNDATSSVFKITQPGSYYLTGNITVTDNRRAIEITANDVTIDLGGFLITSSGTSPHAIDATVSGLRGITVRNGTVLGFASTGVDLGFLNSCTLHDLNVRSCGNGALLGSDARVRDCTFSDNEGAGLLLNAGGSVENCVAAENLTGFSSQGRTVFRGCSARSNAERGFSVLSGAVVTDCSASFNGQDGFWLQSGGTISNSQSTSNLGAGIYLNGYGVATNNNCVSNASGIVAANEASRIDSNHVSLNTVNGIQTISSNNIIVRNTARSNGTNYNIPSGEYAQIITNPGSNFVATNPWANFAY
ncbi:MAG: right-handed parallel beta-helix repeat-containing protein [Planctomycetota bacterium]|nr:right-handed parallel beta-helix repeat-containing protein [Planctomycetota bacterium]